MKYLIFVLAIIFAFTACENEKTEKKTDEKKVETVDTLTKIEKLELEIEKTPEDANLYLSMVNELYKIDSFDLGYKYVELYKEKGGSEETFCMLSSTYFDKTYNSRGKFEMTKRLAEIREDSCLWYNELGKIAFEYFSYKETMETMEMIKNNGCIDEENELRMSILDWEYSVFNIAEHKISIKYPEQWETGNKDNGNSYFFEAKNNVTGANINLTVGNDNNADLLEWYEAVKQELANDENIKVLEYKFSTIGGQACVYARVKVDGKNLPLIQHNYIVLAHDNAYFINITYPKKEEKINKALAHVLAKGVVIEKEETE